MTLQNYKSPEKKDIGYNSPKSILNKSLNRDEKHYNLNEDKNITFLPFIRERNGLGKLIEGVSMKY